MCVLRINFVPQILHFFSYKSQTSFGENIKKLVSARKYVLVKIKPKLTVLVVSVEKEQMILSSVFIVLQKTSREGFFLWIDPSILFLKVCRTCLFKGKNSLENNDVHLGEFHTIARPLFKSFFLPRCYHSFFFKRWDQNSVFQEGIIQMSTPNNFRVCAL